MAAGHKISFEFNLFVKSCRLWCHFRQQFFQLSNALTQPHDVESSKLSSRASEVTLFLKPLSFLQFRAYQRRCIYSVLLSLCLQNIVCDVAEVAVLVIAVFYVSIFFVIVLRFDLAWRQNWVHIYPAGSSRAS